MSTYNEIQNLDELDVLEHPNGTDYQLVDRYAREQLPTKQSTLTAGSRIDITNNVISADSEIDDSESTLENTWSAKKLDDSFVTQEQINELLQHQTTQIQEILHVGSGNLIPYPYTETTKTENGLTFTDNGDRSITINGVATADTYFNLVGTTFYSSSFSIPRNDHYRIQFKQGEKSGVWLGWNVYEPTHPGYNQMSSTMDTADYAITNKYITSDPVFCALRLEIDANTEINNITVYPELLDMDNESNLDVQGLLTEGPGITIDSNNVISAKIDSQTIEFNSNSEIVVSSDITSEIDSLSLHDSQHTSELTSLSTSMSELASVATSLSANDTVQNSQISNLSTAQSEMASELDGKQDSLTAGANISIVNNVISASGGGGGGSKTLRYQATGDGVKTYNQLIAEFYPIIAALTDEELREAYIVATPRMQINYGPTPRGVFRFVDSAQTVAGLINYVFGRIGGYSVNNFEWQKIVACHDSNGTYGSIINGSINKNSTASNIVTVNDLSTAQASTSITLSLYA